MIELIVNNQPVDLGDDFTVKVTKTIADIREPENRQSDYSKTFSLPGTKRNHRIFSHLFELGHVNGTTGATNFAPDFNPNLKAEARLLVDGIEQLAGFIRLLDIKVTDGQQIEYQCSLHGQMADLFANIGNSRLSELDFSEYNHTLTRTAVVNSWDTSYFINGASAAFAYGSGYVHLLIDRGQNKSAKLWEISDLTPALYAKTIVDKIFSEAGYSYSSDSFFNDVTFRHLVIPAAGDSLRPSESEIDARRFRASRVTSAQTRTYGDKFVFNDDSTGSNIDAGSNYDTTTGVYTVPEAGWYQFYSGGTFGINSAGGGIPSGKYVEVEIGFFKNNVLASSYSIQLGQYSGIALTDTIGHILTNQYLQEGGTIDVRLTNVLMSDNSDMSSPARVPAAGFSFQINTGFIFENDIQQYGYSYNTTVNFNRMFNGDFLQRDFLKNFFRMFNLYAEPDKDNPKELIIKPYISFYGSTVRDLSAKLDYSQPLKIEPMGELDANPYHFTYKEDKDIANQNYSGAYGNVYGSKLVQVANDFVRNEKKIEVTFSNTPVIQNEVMTLPWVEFSGGSKGGNIRVLYYGGLVSCPKWHLHNYTSGLAGYDYTGLTSYPYAGHLDSPSTATLDLCFGMPSEVNYTGGTTYTNANLYNTYWRKYINEITDRDSKVVSGYFRVTPADVQKWSFRDLYFFEGQYFRLNKIEDYDCDEVGVTLCEFVKTKSYPVHVPLTKRIPGGWDTTDSDGDVFPGIKNPVVTNGNTGNMPRTGPVYGKNNNVAKDSLPVGNDTIINPRAQTVAVIGGRQVQIGPVKDVAVLMGDNINVTKDRVLYIGKFEANLDWLVGGTAITHTSGDSLTLSTYATDYIWPDYVNVDTSAVGDNVVVRLPAPANIEGRQVVIRNDDGAHIVSVVKEDDTSFDGSVSHTLANAGASMTWRVVDGDWRRYDSKVTDGGTF